MRALSIPSPHPESFRQKLGGLVWADTRSLSGKWVLKAILGDPAVACLLGAHPQLLWPQSLL